jgi:hypothetical protein
MRHAGGGGCDGDHTSLALVGTQSFDQFLEQLNGGTAMPTAPAPRGASMLSDDIL